jgi:hypothetical protein
MHHAHLKNIRVEVKKSAFKSLHQLVAGGEELNERAA